MWAIAKIKKNSFEIFRDNLIQKIGADCKFFMPKILLQKYKNNKIVDNKMNLLGDYVICFHQSFREENIFYNLKYIKGLKYFLDNTLHPNNQKDINNFVSQIKDIENKNGLITKNFLAEYLKINCNYKFLTGPFLSKIFTVISDNKNKIDILIGDLRLNINKSKFLYISI